MTIEIQPEFRPAFEAVEQAICAEFRDGLEAAYLGGSLAVLEAVPGVSDFDCFLFTRDGFPIDPEWRPRTEANLAERFPVVSEFHLNVHSLKYLESESFSRFILRYNSVRFAGVDAIELLATRGLATSTPSAEVARRRLPFVRQCVGAALRGECPPSLGKLTQDPLLRARKLARNFIIVEGAYLLMAYGRFESFRQEAVLRGLKSSFPEWNTLWSLSERVLRDAREAGVSADEFTRQVEPFLGCMLRTLETR